MSKRQNEKKKQAQASDDSAAVFREGFESIVVAILLALLFRGFEAEAFIIPTGSMAQNLQGKHKDHRCPECNHRYRVNQPATEVVRKTTCPMCRFRVSLDPETSPSYNGDRIIVNKFAYEIGDPERWDIIVFKFPGNAKQNYIKRLVGLPNETLTISGGDVYTKPTGESEFTIRRKPADILPQTLQLVHDTRYIPQSLIDADWPARWHDPDSGDAWESSADRNLYTIQPKDEIAWLRYRHLPPLNDNDPRNEWSAISKKAAVEPTVQGRLINDWYTYNSGHQPSQDVPGMHWVGDLAMEAHFDIKTSSGELWLDLVEGGESYRCHIDVASGVATVSLSDGTTLTANTSVRGPGKYRLMWGNLDDRVDLWVNQTAVKWTSDGKPHPGHYPSRGLTGDQFEPIHPVWSPQDGGDLLPAGIGGRNIGLTATKLKIFRDVYYTAVNRGVYGDYIGEYSNISQRQVRSVLLLPPEDSSQCRLVFDSRRKSVTFELAEDQFFPMGDNSPQSKDGRLWADNHSYIVENDEGEIVTTHDRPVATKYVENYVERDLLIGKAIIVYWPHGWPLGPVKLPVNPIPNVDRMGKIR